MTAPLPERLSELLGTATRARLSAYCPYSSYAVGAAVLTTDGRVFAGCNVENISYGLTICAERNAVAAAVAAGLQPGELAAIAIVGAPLTAEAGSEFGPPLPCGACRQVLAEFAARDAVVCCADATRDAQMSSQRLHQLSELLPHPFGAS